LGFLPVPTPQVGGGARVGQARNHRAGLVLAAIILC